MKIGQILKEKPPGPVECIRPTTTLRDTAQHLMKHRIGALVVTDEAHTLCGIVSERDLIHVVANDNPGDAQAPVSNVMTCKVITAAPHDEVAYVLRLMNKNGIRHMPIVENGQLVNMLSIRELTTAYELLQIEANTDPLTELSNRRPFLKTLNLEFERARRSGLGLTVAMIDLDHFKRVNDTYGHDAGDIVLRSVSGMLIAEFRSIDLIGRLGGEEFAVVFPDTELDGAVTASSRLLNIIRSTKIQVDDAQIGITASIGLAVASPEVPNGPAMLKRADELLYQAKNNGRDQLAF